MTKEYKMYIGGQWVDASDRDTRQSLKGGEGARLRAEDVADTVVGAIKLPPRALVREVELWATNP